MAVVVVVVVVGTKGTSVDGMGASSLYVRVLPVYAAVVEAFWVLKGSGSSSSDKSVVVDGLDIVVTVVVVVLVVCSARRIMCTEMTDAVEPTLKPTKNPAECTLVALSSCRYFTGTALMVHTATAGGETPAPGPKVSRETVSVVALDTKAPLLKYAALFVSSRRKAGRGFSTLSVYCRIRKPVRAVSVIVSCDEDVSTGVLCVA